MYRSHIHLHLGDCPQRVVKCTVKGCHNFNALEEEAEHDKQYQESHQVLLKQVVVLYLLLQQTKSVTIYLV